VRPSERISAIIAYRRFAREAPGQSNAAPHATHAFVALTASF
jgi:hypothetical protein